MRTCKRQNEGDKTALRSSLSAQCHAGQAGLTLLELLVALLVVGGLVALAVPSMQSVTGMRVREETSRIAGTIAYLYNHASISGRTCRIVFTMNPEDDDHWAAECTEDPPRLHTEIEQVRRGTIEARFQEDDWHSRSTREDDSLERRIKERARWNQFSSRTIQPATLSSGIQIGGVWTARLSDAITEGEAYLYFFPTGETQRALIYLVDSWDNEYTLDVQPITGRVRITNGWEDIPRG